MTTGDSFLPPPDRDQWLQAWADQATASATPPPPVETDSGWTIRWGGSTWTEADFTGQHLSVLALITGNDDFASLDLDPRHGHQRLMLVITAFLAVQNTRDVTDATDAAEQVAKAMREVADAPVEEILGALIPD